MFNKTAVEPQILRTDFLLQSNGRLADQRISHLLWNSKVYCQVLNNPTRVTSRLAHLNLSARSVVFNDIFIQ
jgi:hypothetical protein